MSIESQSSSGGHRRALQWEAWINRSWSHLVKIFGDEVNAERATVILRLLKQGGAKYHALTVRDFFDVNAQFVRAAPQFLAVSGLFLSDTATLPKSIRVAVSFGKDHHEQNPLGLCVMEVVIKECTFKSLSSLEKATVHESKESRQLWTGMTSHAMPFQECREQIMRFLTLMGMLGSSDMTQRHVSCPHPGLKKLLAQELVNYTNVVEMGIRGFDRDPSEPHHSHSMKPGWPDFLTESEDEDEDCGTAAYRQHAHAQTDLALLHRQIELPEGFRFGVAPAEARTPELRREVRSVEPSLPPLCLGRAHSVALHPPQLDLLEQLSQKLQQMQLSLDLLKDKVAHMACSAEPEEIAPVSPRKGPRTRSSRHAQ
jgi:hypothetical protein